jgi:hypothetical protein
LDEKFLLSEVEGSPGRPAANLLSNPGY